MRLNVYCGGMERRSCTEIVHHWMKINDARYAYVWNGTAKTKIWYGVETIQPSIGWNDMAENGVGRIIEWWRAWNHR